jgi:hypothetical protein
MANGTINPRSDQLTSTNHNSLLGRDAADQHSIEAITGLRNELNDIRNMCGSSLQTTLNAFMNSYMSTFHDDLVTRSEFEAITSQLNNIIAVVETWDPENEESTLEKLIKDVSELQTRVSTLPELLTAITVFNESNFTAAKAVETMTTELADLKTKLEELSSSGSEAGDQLTGIDARLITAEADILNLKGADTEQASVLTQLTQATGRYLPGTETKGELLETIEAADAKIPTTVEISRKTDVWEDGGDPFSNTTDYLDYNVNFKDDAGESKFSTDLLLTSDINTYLDQALKKLLTGSKITGFDSRLSFVEGRLSNVVQYVAHMASYHSFVIKDIGFYFVGGEGHLDYLPEPIDPTPGDTIDIQANFVNVVPDLPESARIDTKVFSPAELAGKNFYVIFKTSFPIDLSANKVCLGFPNFEESSNIKYAPYDGFKCARLGIPDLSYATYVLYADLNSETKKLTPFTFGSGAHAFGTYFDKTGTYKFMLRVTDPYNPNTTAELAKNITVGLPIYHGIYEDPENNGLSIESFSSGLVNGNFALLHTDFNSPATTIDWYSYNDLIAKTNINAEKAKSYYYYYVVPTALVEDKTLRFNTGYGPGGWVEAGDSISINDLSYTVYRTVYKLTYCPTTVITVIDTPN